MRKFLLSLTMALVLVGSVSTLADARPVRGRAYYNPGYSSYYYGPSYYATPGYYAAPGYYTTPGYYYGGSYYGRPGVGVGVRVRVR